MSADWALELVAGGPEPAAGARDVCIPLKPGVTSFGRVRDPNVQVLLQSKHISSKHCSITVAQDSSVQLEDVSTNGCVVFGPGGTQRKVKKNTSPLAEGDFIRFGLDGDKAVDSVEYKYLLRRVSDSAGVFPHLTRRIRAGTHPAGRTQAHRLTFSSSSISMATSVPR